ncbi:hypothetical protein NX059_008824 [Plenodomus lindquistii]|nr:hypothetical protein NX059_008824 [Plenodomus lindquistii]
MSVGTAKALAEQGIAPLNFIYACSLCCASFADVYEGHNESVRGLSDGINPKERVVTRMYLATCCHVFCSSHLEGGAPPFHPAGQRPKASCPVCTKEKGDREVRELYSVRGFNKDEYDPQIPPSWFTAPPIRLDGSEKEMEALRFQYIALIRYCQNTRAARKLMQNALAEAEHGLSRLQDLASDQHDKVLSLQGENHHLQAEVERYRGLDVNPRDLETFRANKAAIRHYLKLVPLLLDQNEKMRERLASLGFAMALQPVPNFRGLSPDAFDSDESLPANHAADLGRLARKTASSHTVGRSAHTSGRVATAPPSPSGQRPLKRQRQESSHSGDLDALHPTSREAMPPPPKPISRMQSVRRIIPTIRKKLSHPRAMSSREDVSQITSDVPQIEQEYWQSSRNDRRALRHVCRDATPYMSGALPIDTHHETSPSRETPVLLSTGMADNRSDLIIQDASPVKAMKPVTGLQPVRLPAEPSYIRLMDGLSQDEEVDLKLKDPREGDTGNHHNAHMLSRYSNIQPSRHSPGAQTKKEFWNLRRTYLHQPPHRFSPMPQSHEGRDHADTSEASGFREYYELPDDPVSPASLRYQQPDPGVENVFKSFRRLSVSKTQEGYGSHRLA